MTVVALVLLITTGMKLYRPNIQALKPMYSNPTDRHRALRQFQLFITDKYTDSRANLKLMML